MKVRNILMTLAIVMVAFLSTKIDAKAEAEGFKPTFGTEFGWYQKLVKGKNRHFLWNPETQTFEIQKKVNFCMERKSAEY